ncbi:glycosyltransferase [Caldilinea sp.]|uniref:glycosyltransferase n=1 Tax=Caldilinea sp. TaxID=2293560 RepID=UPI0021DBCCD9|nr:nucleotide disphospho-sugar-binding domain-containing protein [Caldilinea sp.]GIV69676.1 MAG: hypothetical protein KatS3mg048_2538 [Caldilinea sp.]
MRFLFVSAPLPGHLDWGGFLAAAVALQRRGHEVIWASGEAVAAQVQQEGVRFASLAETGWRWPPPPPMARPAQMADAAWRRLRRLRALDQWLEPARVEAGMAALEAVAAEVQPDAIVSEMFIVASGLVAERIRRPLIVVGWPAVEISTGAEEDVMAEASARMARLLRIGGCEGVNFTRQGPPALRSPHLHLTFWSERWYAGLALAPQTRHAGGLPLDALPADATLPSPEDAPWVVITLGTTFNRDPAFFLAAARAAVNLGCRPILLLGRSIDPAGDDRWLERLPAEAVVREFADFRTLLPYAAAAIHHGGAGTTHALVRAAVPQIVVPHAGEQLHQARGVARTGVGLHLPPEEATVERLTAALAALLPDLSPYRARAAALREEFARLGGPPAAAQMVERSLT